MRGTRDVDELAGEVVIRRDLLADLDEVLGADPELGELSLRGSTFALAKWPRIGAWVVRFALAAYRRRAGRQSIRRFSAVRLGHDLQALELRGR
jgi:hypothetical protein